ncbi:hypothetical protein [Rhizobium mongolense]|uniref:PAP2 superfamily protein n=1 Tax=Rhizobium mongolense TaxID=57676 RepID=A0A7W6RRC9_9HYPH|nr:hypothetical protein [Rhizobium mongolense]MBB4277154.1 hypothetical protein [Rhizobium mongolense]
MTAKQAADARMWAGVHFRSDAVAGQKIGEGVAEQVNISTAPAVGATLAFDWGYRKKVAEAHGGESDCQPSM